MYCDISRNIIVALEHFNVNKKLYHVDILNINKAGLYFEKIKEQSDKNLS